MQYYAWTGHPARKPLIELRRPGSDIPTESLDALLAAAATIGDLFGDGMSTWIGCDAYSIATVLDRAPWHPHMLMWHQAPAQRVTYFCTPAEWARAYLDPANADPGALQLRLVNDFEGDLRALESVIGEMMSRRTTDGAHPPTYHAEPIVGANLFYERWLEHGSQTGPQQPFVRGADNIPTAAAEVHRHTGLAAQLWFDYVPPPPIDHGPAALRVLAQILAAPAQLGQLVQLFARDRAFGHAPGTPVIINSNTIGPQLDLWLTLGGHDGLPASIAIRGRIQTGPPSLRQFLLQHILNSVAIGAHSLSYPA